ncbi:MAG: deoxyribodipyrimidine photolyase [Acidobacteriota bacterium]|nr:deoxyribodipyrimidine photolyase [Acidobacteriota bacterium]
MKDTKLSDLDDTIKGPFSRRVQLLNDSPMHSDAGYVLYWMIAARRTSFNFALDRAIAWAQHFKRPLIVFEPLRVDYPWASDRLHRFVIDGMADNAREFESTNVFYYPYVEPVKGAAKGVLQALAENACVVVTDDFPAFFLPRMLEATARRVAVRLESVDSNGLLPMRLADHAFTAAFHFRRHVQKHLPDYIARDPKANPLTKLQLPKLEQEYQSNLQFILSRWPPASRELLDGNSQLLSELPIDHEVSVAPIRGGHSAAHSALTKFMKHGLDAYVKFRNEPEADATSRLSPYLHFGHLATHEIFQAIARREKWTLSRLAAKPSGIREGWWGVSVGAEAFLDQLVVWRELGFNMCAMQPDNYARFDSLPEWAQQTLEIHESDLRPHNYSRAQLESAQTHDPLWNAAQNQLRQEGWFHNYMRMLWGKKILEWSPQPRQALGHMIALMNRWSLDGRDPISYSGYFWVLGRYDRPWPERSVYGKIRSMTSESAARKFPTTKYIARYSS